MTDSLQVQQPALGERLRQARESLGLTQREAAEKLCLLKPCIVAMEENNYGYFRAAIFAKGYLRSYVKLLELDEEQAMEDYAQLASQIQFGKVDNTAVDRKFGAKPNHAFAAMALVLLIVAVIGWWVMPSSAPVDTTSKVPAQSDMTIDLSPAQVDPLQGSSVLLSNETTTRIDPSNMPKVLARTAENRVDEENLAGQIEGQSLPEQSLPEQATVEVTGEALLTLTFQADCWVRVIDANGKTLVSDLKRANQTVELNGEPPYKILLGNAPAASLSYNGELITINKIARDKSARITVGES